LSIEEKLKAKILQNYRSIRVFSQIIGVPNSTIATILTKGILNASVTTMIHVCRELNIDLDKLVDGEIVDISEKKIYPFNAKEIDLIKKYRAIDERGQQTVDAFLQIQYELVFARKEESSTLTSEPATVPVRPSILDGRLTVAQKREIMERELAIEEKKEAARLKASIGTNGDAGGMAG